MFAAAVFAALAVPLPPLTLELTGGGKSLDIVTLTVTNNTSDTFVQAYSIGATDNYRFHFADAAGKRVEAVHPNHIHSPRWPDGIVYDVRPREPRLMMFSTRSCFRGREVPAGAMTVVASTRYCCRDIFSAPLTLGVAGVVLEPMLAAGDPGRVELTVTNGTRGPIDLTRLAVELYGPKWRRLPTLAPPLAGPENVAAGGVAKLSFRVKDCYEGGVVPNWASLSVAVRYRGDAGVYRSEPLDVLRRDR